MESIVIIAGALLAAAAAGILVWLRLRRRRTPAQAGRHALRGLQRERDRARRDGGRVTGDAKLTQTNTHAASNVNEIGGGGPW